MRKRWAFNEKGERRCHKCKHFLQPTPENFYFNAKGDIYSYCKRYCSGRKNDAMEKSILQKFRKQSVSTVVLYRALSVQHGPAIATRMVNLERQALGLPVM